MIDVKKTVAVAALAAVALAATDLSASAQSTLTNGPNGMQPNTLASDNPNSALGTSPSRSMANRRAMRKQHMTMKRHQSYYRAGAPVMHTSYAYRQPLTVRRTVVAAPPPVVAAAPAPVVAGPGTLVTGPLGFASNIFTLPFRAINGIFPATGDVAANPLVVIGAPLHAIGDIVQLPLRVLGAPFGGTTIATY